MLHPAERDPTRPKNSNAPRKKLIKSQHCSIGKLERLNRTGRSGIKRIEVRTVESIVTVSNLQGKPATVSGIFEAQRSRVDTSPEDYDILFPRTPNIINEVEAVTEIKKIRIMPGSSDQHIVT